MYVIVYIGVGLVNIVILQSFCLLFFQARSALSRGDTHNAVQLSAQAKRMAMFALVFGIVGVIVAIIVGVSVGLTSVSYCYGYYC